MSWSLRYLTRYGTIAGAALVGLGLSGSVHGQTLPIAGNPQQANAQERDAIRGVREQDEAAARVSAQLNGGSQGAASGATANNMDELLRAGIVIDARNPNRLNVQRVLPGSPAAMAGLRPGDVITRVNGSPVTSLTAVAQSLLSGNTSALGLQVDRNGQSRQLNVSLPDTSARLAALPQTGGQPSAGGNQAPMTVGGAVVPGTGVPGANTTGTAGGLSTGNTGVTPGLGTTTAQSAGGQAVAAGQPAGAGQGTATAPALSAQGGTTSGTTTAPITTPFPASAATQGNPTSPGLLVQPNTTSGLPTSVPGVPTSVPGLPTSTPGVSPSPGTGSGGATPSATSSQGTVNPSVGGGTSAISGTSGLTPSAVSSSQGAVNPSIGGGTPGTIGTTGTGATATGATATSGAGTGTAGSSASGGVLGGAGGGTGNATGGGAAAGAGGAGAGGT